MYNLLCIAKPYLPFQAALPQPFLGLIPSAIALSILQTNQYYYFLPNTIIRTTSGAPIFILSVNLLTTLPNC